MLTEDSIALDTDNELEFKNAPPISFRPTREEEVAIGNQMKHMGPRETRIDPSTVRQRKLPPRVDYKKMTNANSGSLGLVIRSFQVFNALLYLFVD